MAKRVKYLGSADRRILPKGENFGGQLAEPLDKDLEWTPETNHILDLEEEGVSEEAVSLILEQDDFRDVTDLKRIPASENEKIFRGAPSSTEPAGSSGGGGTAGTAAATGGTTTGGSTGGGGTSGSSRGTTGGSTRGGG